MVRLSIFLIAVALIAGTVGCVYTPIPSSQNLEIQTWYDLDKVRNNLAGNHTLINDLDSTTAGYEELASSTANQGKGWEPIGSFYTAPFTGSFDGQGYEIRDLFINRPHEGNPVALFAFVGEAGAIQNVSVVNTTVTSESDVGGLVGQNDGTVSNSYSIGSISGNEVVGGLVGLNYGIVSDSYSSSNVTGEGRYVGGLVGLNGGSVSNSYSSGNVTGNSSVGGLVGYNDDGTVSNSYSTGNVAGNSSAGGLVGLNYESTVSNSFWDIETSGQSTSAGGTGKTTAEMQDMVTFSGAAWEICAVPPGATNPAYTWNIVDHGAYPFLSWQPVSTSQNQQPVEITSVLGPLQPINFAGPIVEITLKNVALEPVISLTATLKVFSASSIPFDFTFDDVSPSNPLQPDGSTSDTCCLVGGGFSSNDSYPLTINATLQNGAKFVYTKPVQIVEPPLNIGGIFAIRDQI